MFIYRLTNQINNKVYIGLTKKKPKYRLAEHVKSAEKGSGWFIHAAIRKYGIENFSFEVIYQIITQDKKDLIDAEIYFIKEHNCCILDGREKGYNMTRGGQFMDSEQASLNNKKRVKDGTHYLLSEKANEIRRKTAALRIENGTHNFQGEEASKRASKRNNDNVINGTNPFTIERTCPYCKLTGKGLSMLRYHFDNCKLHPFPVPRPIVPKKCCPHCDKIVDHGNYKKSHGDKCKHFIPSHITPV